MYADWWVGQWEKDVHQTRYLVPYIQFSTLHHDGREEKKYPNKLNKVKYTNLGIGTLVATDNHKLIAKTRQLPHVDSAHFRRFHLVGLCFG